MLFISVVKPWRYQNKYLGAEETMWQPVKMLVYVISGQNDGEIVT